MTIPIKRDEFKINTNSVAFRLLTERLYSDPFMSTLRELLNNAYDSYVDRSIKENIDIHSIKPIEITTKTEPLQSLTEISIRDYGTGLSKKDMETLYTTYFCSNKENRSDLVGGFGIGSKSPLSLSKDFISISYYNGMKYSYLIFLDEQGMPSFTLLEESKTDEDNGLEVKYKIDEEISSLRIQQYDFLNYIPVRVLLNKNTIVDPSDICNKYIFENNEFKIGIMYKRSSLVNGSGTTDNCDYSLNSIVHIKCGNILYESNDELTDILTDEENGYYKFRGLKRIVFENANYELLGDDIKNMHYNFIRTYIELKGDSFNLALSREKIELDNKIINFFKNNNKIIIGRFIENFIDRYSEYLENLCKSVNGYKDTRDLSKILKNDYVFDIYSVNNYTRTIKVAAELFNSNNEKILEKYNMKFRAFKISFHSKTKKYEFNNLSYDTRYNDYLDYYNRKTNLQYLSVIPFEKYGTFSKYSEIFAEMSKNKYYIKTYNIIRRENGNTQIITDNMLEFNYLIETGTSNYLDNLIIVLNHDIKESIVSGIVTKNVSKNYNLKVYVVPDDKKADFMKLLLEAIDMMPLKPKIIDEIRINEETSITELEFKKQGDSYYLSDNSNKKVNSSYFDQDEIYHIDEDMYNIEMFDYYASELIPYISNKDTVRIIKINSIIDEQLLNSIKSFKETICSYAIENKIFSNLFLYYRYVLASVLLSNDYNNANIKELIGSTIRSSIPIIDVKNINTKIRFDVLEKIVSNIESLSFKDKEQYIDIINNLKDINVKKLYKDVMKNISFINFFYKINSMNFISKEVEGYIADILNIKVVLGTNLYFNIHNSEKKYEEIPEEKSVYFNILEFTKHDKFCYIRDHLGN